MFETIGNNRIEEYSEYHVFIRRKYTYRLNDISVANIPSHP